MNNHARRPYGADNPLELTLPGGSVTPMRSNTPLQTLELILGFANGDGNLGPALAPSPPWRASPRP